MTDQTPDYSRPLKDIPLAPAALQACKECPWRASSLDALDEKRNDPTFSRPNMTVKWKALVENGATCRCHLTTPGYYHHDEALHDAGFKEPREFKGDGHRQCAGQLAMVRNELGKLDEYATHADYLADNPTGLTEPVAEHFRAILEDPSSAPVPFRWPAEDATDVLDPAHLVDLDSIWWKRDENWAVNMKNSIELIRPELAACDCRFCAQHEQIHAGESVRLADGSSVVVDRGVACVVAAFGAAGINTSASCENFGTALRQFDLTAFLALRDSPAGGVNYSRPLTEGGAFVRFSSHTKSGQLAAAQLDKFYSVDQHGAVAQVTFPLQDARKVSLIIRTAAEKTAA